MERDISSQLPLPAEKNQKKPTKKIKTEYNKHTVA